MVEVPSTMLGNYTSRIQCATTTTPNYKGDVREVDRYVKERLQSGTSSEAAKYLTGTMSGIRYMKFDKTNYTMESTFIINKLLTQ